MPKILHCVQNDKVIEPLVVSLSNHTSEEEVPLISFDMAQDERDSVVLFCTPIYGIKH